MSYFFGESQNRAAGSGGVECTICCSARRGKTTPLGGKLVSLGILVARYRGSQRPCSRVRLGHVHRLHPILTPSIETPRTLPQLSPSSSSKSMATATQYQQRQRTVCPTLPSPPLWTLPPHPPAERPRQHAQGRPGCPRLHQNTVEPPQPPLRY